MHLTTQCLCTWNVHPVVYTIYGRVCVCVNNKNTFYHPKVMAYIQATSVMLKQLYSHPQSGDSAAEGSISVYVNRSA